MPETDDHIEAFWHSLGKQNAWYPNYYGKVLSDLTFHNEYGFVKKTF